jgi:calcineurin-like phosphoesterase family protein
MKADPRRHSERRAFLRNGALCLAALGTPFPAATQLIADEEAKPAMHIGLLTDVHYADKPTGGARHYRESTTKMQEAVAQFKKAGAETDLVIELGDFIDAAKSPAQEFGWIETINKLYRSVPGEKHYVLGNHCVDTLTKDEFLKAVGQSDAYCAFDHGGYHFVILDACFRQDGVPYGRKNFKWTDSNIPAEELDWLRRDLAKTSNPALVFIHQRLDIEGHHAVKNAAAVRGVLETSGKVTAVFQGHNHKNDYRDVAGIHYCTLPAMVDKSGKGSNAFARLDVMPDGTLQLHGFQRQKSYVWKNRA